jgi:short-subunit dehydrogenase
MNILVTGASRGIGFEIVKEFAGNSENNIVALSRNLNLLTDLKKICQKEFNNDIHIYSIDFLSSSFKDDLKHLLLDLNTHFDIIINNAGLLINESFEKTSDIDIQKIYQVNVFAPVTLLQNAILYLDPDKMCHIINIGSMGGFQGSAKFPGLSIYSSSKAALANLTECLAEEYKDKNIKINCLALGSVQTEMLNSAFPGYKAQVSPQEMAKCIVRFSQQKPVYLNGKVVPVSNTTP